MNMVKGSHAWELMESFADDIMRQSLLTKPQNDNHQCGVTTIKGWGQLNKEQGIVAYCGYKRLKNPVKMSFPSFNVTYNPCNSINKEKTQICFEGKYKEYNKLVAFLFVC